MDPSIGLKLVLPTAQLLADWAGIIPLLVFPIMIGLVLLSVWLTKRAAVKRRAQIQSMATELGLDYLQVRPGEFDGRITKYKLVHYGRNRQSSNFITAKTDELSLIIFDHEYTTGSGKSKKIHRQTVAWVISQQLHSPEFVLSPESWFDRIADLFSKKDIDIAQDPQFSKAFVLIGDDAEKIRQFFDNNRRDALLKIKPPTIESFAGEFMFYRPNRRAKPAEIKALMNEAFELYQAFANKNAPSSSD